MERVTVSTAGEVDVVTLDEVKQHLGQSVDVDDDLIWQQYVPAAQAIAADFIRAPVKRHTFLQSQASIDYIRKRRRFLLRGAVQSITSIKYRDTVDGTLQTESSAVYTLDAGVNTAEVAEAEGKNWSSAGAYVNAWQVTFVAGWIFSDVPAEVKAAILLLTEHLYDGSKDAREAAEALLTPLRLPPW